MKNIILVNAVDPEECRIANVIDNKLEEFHIESAAKEITHGNIYKGIITRIEPGLQAVFVDYGSERNGFLQNSEIHSDYYQDKHSKNNLVKIGQEILVQITKDPFMKKGAMLTTFISLPGRHLVLLPGSKNIGISRKIEDEKERKRLKDLLHKLKISEGFGVIVRTAGDKCTKTSLSKDLTYLMRLWKNIKSKVMRENAPKILYKERNLVLRSLRDYLTPDVTEILIDDNAVYLEAKEFIKVISPAHEKKVKLHKGFKPIFAKYQLEQQIASIYKNRVSLKSGGSIVIEQTEALVAIDVNSGKATHKKSIEETALLTNIEAAEEIGRQLRLRDMGGLVVIDFIDLKSAKNKLKIEKTLKQHVKKDKAKTKVGKISKFGLVEMSRQRLKPSIDFGNFEVCKYCGGKGLTPSPEALGIAFMRRLSQEAIKDGANCIKGIVPVEVADYLLNKKRKELLEFETRRAVKITIKGDPGLIPGDDKVVYEK